MKTIKKAKGSKKAAAQKKAYNEKKVYINFDMCQAHESHLFKCLLLLTSLNFVKLLDTKSSEIESGDQLATTIFLQFYVQSFQHKA